MEQNLAARITLAPTSLVDMHFVNRTHKFVSLCLSQKHSRSYTSAGSSFKTASMRRVSKIIELGGEFFKAEVSVKYRCGSAIFKIKTGKPSSPHDFSEKVQQMLLLSIIPSPQHSPFSLSSHLSLSVSSLSLPNFSFLHPHTAFTTAPCFLQDFPLYN